MLIEGALALAAFTAITFGLFETGRAFWTRQALNECAAKGAAWARVHGQWAEPPSNRAAGNPAPAFPFPSGYQITQADTSNPLIQYMQTACAPGLDVSRLAIWVIWPDLQDSQGARVQVNTRYQYRGTDFKFTQAFWGANQLLGKATERITH